MEFITKMLGETVKRTPWQDINKLPYLITDEYRIQQVTVGTQPCLFLTPKDNLGTIAAIKKHIQRIKTVCDFPVVFELTSLSRQRKETFIEAKIAFVVPDKQLYLPFMGTFLQDKYDHEIPVPEKLLPSAQMVLFYFIYHQNKPLYLSKIAPHFGFSAMTISRAANQLVQIGLLTFYKEGTQKILKTDLTKKELYKKAFPYLINPVRRKVYIDKKDIASDYFLAGMSALSKKTMMNPPSTTVYGTTKAVKATSAYSNLVDSEKQCEVELWRYDPTKLQNCNHVDDLSLILSLIDVHNERVEQIIEELLETVLKEQVTQ